MAAVILMSDSGAKEKDPPRLRLVGDAPPEAGSEGARDEELVRAYLAGDDQAFTELVRRHQRLVFALCRRYAWRAEDARDLAQRAFLKSVEAFRRLRLPARGGEPLPVKALIVRIAVNLGKNHARQERRWAVAPVEEAERSAQADAPELLARAEDARRMRAAVVELPRRQREVLTLRVDGDLPFSEVAKVLGITENNAKVHFHHAVRRLRELVLAGLPEEAR